MQFYYKLREFPFIKLIIPFCLGILTGYFCQVLPSYALVLIALLIFTSIFLIRLTPSCMTRGLIILSVFFLCGFTIIQNKLIKPEINSQQELRINAQIVSDPVKKPKYTKFIVNIDSENCNSFKILTYIFDDDTINLRKGDRIFFTSRLKRIENSGNSSFDYKNYMRRQYVEYSAFVGDNDYKRIECKGISFLSFCSDIRKGITNTLKISGIREPELGLLKAMLLGAKDSLDTEIKNDYIGAGAIHFLAISGLHTGIVFILISFVLLNIFRLRKTGLLFTLLSIGLLWCYAIITGLPSSVLRASIILTLIVFGKYLRRDINLYNAIAASALIILLFEPGSLFSPGFQLSYAAYTAIIFLYPKLYRLLVCKNKFLDSIWKLSVVSIAAQLGTLPLSILYFQHIYCYSLLTNLCISCFIPVIIYGGFSCILIAFIIPGRTIISELLSSVIKLVNYLINSIANLPGAISETINFSIPETILIYIILAGSFTMLWYKKKKIIFIILTSALLLSSYNSYKKFANINMAKQQLKYKQCKNKHK